MVGVWCGEDGVGVEGDVGVVVEVVDVMVVV